MEQQFILRLPEKLRNVEPKDCKLIQNNQNEVTFCHRDKEYKGIICKLPTIVESQKEIDNKLYKIADISTLVVIYDTNFDLEEEISKIQSSGLTPPMHRAKDFRFNQASAIRSEEIEKIEREVSNLLRDDAAAIKVEISTNDKESDDLDLDIIAAEIEEDLPIVKTNDSHAKPRKMEEPQNLGMDDLMAPNVSQTTRIEPIKQIEPKVENRIDDEELKAIQKKLEEKEELLRKAANPILKKRFEQNVNELKKEYEERLKQLNKK